jgi:hypothetical protein
MKTTMKTHLRFNALSFAFLLSVFASCKKDSLVNPAWVTQTTTATTDAAVASTQAVAVAAIRGIAGDSIYVVGTCARDHHRDSVAFSSLPAAVASYLTTNYAGYTFQKAFTDKDTSGNTAGYVVIIQYNDKPVGLKFDAAGVFASVLEQREGHDLQGHGWHHGGRFDDRDGMRRDTLALGSLSAGITNYFAANYAQDTLVRAYYERDSSVVVLSNNNGVFATVFDSNGTFIKRAELPSRSGRASSVELTALPSTAQTYLTTTYPNYVFKQAFQIIQDGSLEGYAVFIDANGTKYALAFDASGNFIKAITII